MTNLFTAKKRVMEQVKGKDPKQIGFWFLDKSLILLHEAQVPKEEIIKHVQDFKA